MVAKGKIEWISGPAIRASNMAQAKMYEVVQVGEEKLIGEIIKLTGDIAFIQVYESTSGLRPGEPVIGTGQPLSVTLGPGCIGTIYDGLQRPLDTIAKKAGPFITRGVSADSISFEKKWEFEPTVNKGDEIEGGSVIGKVQETPLIEHKVLAPPNLPKSKVRDVSREGKYTVDEVVVESEDKSGKRYELKLYHKWPVRVPRPIKERLDPEVPLITGQRVLDSFFPMAKGGTGAIPGGFGTGKCVPPDTPVLLSNGELIPIEALYNKFARADSNNEEDLVPARGVHVISFDGSSLVNAEVSYVYKGKTDRLVKIRTRSGRSIEVTPAHKLITFSHRGIFEERAASELKRGDFIVMPRKIPVAGRYQIIEYSIHEKDEPVEIPRLLDEYFAEFLGLLIPCGTLSDNSLVFLTDSIHLQRRFSNLAKRIFRLSDDLCVATNGRVLIKSYRIASLIGRLCDLTRNGEGCNKIPSIIMCSPTHIISAFIKGYFLSNGSFSNDRVSLSSNSKSMIEGLSYLLGRLGIIFSISLEAGYYEIGISGLELKNFANSIGVSKDDIVSFSKLSALAQYVSNLDSLNVDRQGKLIEVVNGGLAQLQLVDYRLAKYENIENALEWVFLDEIESIEVLMGERQVYDITVPKFHNFIGGSQPTLLHNTVTLHSIAKWADSKVVLHIGCGERGNEMTEVLVEFPELVDPRTGRPLMERTILVANVSNMPVAAREASIYTGVTMAEYYRDMGYDVVLVADSTSRWAEALREISGRLEEMPAEEGYPSYLASRLAEFYERAGRVRALGTPDRTGSVTLIGAVSPAGADFTEPVTSQTIRFVRTFWALDTRLAYSRHYPAINWMTSYSGYIDFVSRWWASKIDKDWLSIRNQAYGILQREDALKEIVRLLGPEALPDEEKLILDVARMIQIGFLQQNAYDEVDAYCSPEKQFKMMRMFVQFYDEALKALRAGVPLAKIRSMQVISKMLRSKFAIKNEELEKFDELVKEMLNEFKIIAGVQEVKLAE